MTKKTKKAIVIYGGVAAVGLAGYLYWKSKQPAAAPAVPAAPATPAATLLPGQASTLTHGQLYTITALLPAGINDAPSLAVALKAAGWTGISVWALSAGAAGTMNGIMVPAGGYVAQATWSGSTGPVPANIVAISGAVAPPPGVTPLATA